MSRNTTSPKIARPTRTALQGGAGYLVAQFVDEVIYDMSPAGVLLLALILTPVVSFLQTAVEDYFGKALLRDIPEPDAPVADTARGERGTIQDAGKFALGLLVVLLLALLLARLF